MARKVGKGTLRYNIKISTITPAKTSADLFKSLTRVSLDFELLITDVNLFRILDEGCKHRPILKIILKMWIACFN